MPNTTSETHSAARLAAVGLGCCLLAALALGCPGAAADPDAGVELVDAGEVDAGDLSDGGASQPDSGVVPCVPANACHVGIDVNGTCEDTGANVEDGTACGASQFCDAGVCASCGAGTACVPDNPCHLGAIACTSTLTTCNDTGASVADGAACGAGLKCASGTCVANADGGAVTPFAGCNGLIASTDPAVNQANILACLAGSTVASPRAVHFLSGTVYPLTGQLRVPPGSVLRTQPGYSARATLRMGPPCSATSRYDLLELQDGALVENLVLDANSAIRNSTVCGIVLTYGSQITLRGNKLTNLPGILKSKLQDPVCGGVNAIHISHATDARSLIVGNEISNMFRGVLAYAGGVGADSNVISDNQIHHIGCEGVNLRGFATVLRNTFQYCGFACGNGIPGAAIYGKGNAVGAVVSDNVAHDSCGLNVDIDTDSNWVFTGNTSYDPGYPGIQPEYACGSYADTALLDISGWTITGNSSKNSHRPWNRCSTRDPNKMFGTVASGAGVCGDLGVNRSVGLVLGHRYGATATVSTHNLVAGNTFQSFNAADSGVVGVAFFASRGSGWTGGAGNVGNWVPTVLNRNFVGGSNIGSIRCGQNKYGVTTDTVTGSHVECPYGPGCNENQDDDQHERPTNDSWRNDKCF